MDYTAISTAVSSLGFPIVACVALYIQNNKLRETIEENTRAVSALAELIKERSK